eukprot:g394.t1
MSKERRRRAERSPSRSRSPPRKRSRSPPSPRRRPRRSRSRSSGRDHPPPSEVLGVFGLAQRTSEDDLRDIFGEFGEIDSVKLIMDKQRKQSRGFAFIYFFNQEDAARARRKLNGTDAARARRKLNGTTLDGRKVRVDFSLTKMPHAPTPGKYMGSRRSRSASRSPRRSPRRVRRLVRARLAWPYCTGNSLGQG